jgi:predicted glutamine amidotransferase
MECNTPTDITFSFSGLAVRGGQTGPHGDGFGLAFYEENAARVFLDPRASAVSPLASFLREHSIKTELAVAHIRKKTRGGVSLANTHPFMRELWGRAWVFAHNGTVRGIKRKRLGHFNPIGDTDSEHAFCWLLEGLRARFRDYPKSARALRTTVADLGAEIAKFGTFNFLLGDGRALYARCDTKLCYIVRQAPFGRATLADADVSIDFAAVTTPRDRVAVVATAPLTKDETWTLGVPGTLWVFREGSLVATLPSPNGKRNARPRRARTS